jgi:hypothetical protein
MESESKSSQMLKEEINKINDVGYDLAKWKLVVTAALGAAAIGLGSNTKPGSDPHLNPSWLLLLIPFVCAYIDLHGYQNALRVLVISNFLSRHKAGDDVLRAYEQHCASLRGEKKFKGVFTLAEEAGTASSIVMSVIAPVLYLVIRRGGGFWDAWGSVTSWEKFFIVLVWVVGMLLSVALRVQFWQIRKRLAEEPAPVSQDTNTAGT